MRRISFKKRGLKADGFIHYPIKLSEFEVQLKLFNRIKQEGIDVRGCVPSAVKEFGMDHAVYLDLVVFSEWKTPIAIIECKNRSKNSQFVGIGERQRRRYSSFGIPMLICDREAAIEETVKKVVELVGEYVY